jgi:GH25 family lysozyme M1 (1,4-beta-N-acetylmuramidase)
MNKALGIDVSKYDVPLDFTKATVPIDFVIQRAGYGMVRDEKFEENWLAVQAIKIRGAYHYYSTGVPWKDQADRFLSIIDGRNFFAVDYEAAYNNLNASSATGLRSMLEYVAPKLAPHKVLLYTNPGLYKDALMPYGTWMNSWELWIAQYPSLSSLNLDKGPTLPTGRTQWTFWQYGAGDVTNTAGYNAGPSHGTGWHGCDLDQANGGLDVLRAWAGVDTPAPIPAPVPLPVSEKAARMNELLRAAEYITERMGEL